MYIRPVIYTVAIQLVLLDYYFHSSLRTLSWSLNKGHTLADPSSETECFSVTCLCSALVADTSSTVHFTLSLAYHSAESYRYNIQEDSWKCHMNHNTVYMTALLEWC